MDKRTVLRPGTLLPFPGMECTVASLVGRGSNAMVYLGHYPDQHNPMLRHQVLIKELFPYEPGGRIYRDEDGEICCLEDAEDTWELHRLSFDRGNEIHIRLLEEHPGDLDSNINTFSMNRTLYSILGFTGGRSLEAEMGRPGGRNDSLGEHIRRIHGVLNVLEAFHQSGFLHLDISPDNILLIGEGRKERVTLIDYNSVHTIQEIREGKSVYYSAKEGYTAPEIRAGKTGEVGYGSDLYALTAVFYWCLTGDKLTPMQIVRSAVPDISEAPCLKGVPNTVYSMVRQILKKGLCSIPGRRYRNVEQMRLDLEELEDRISGKGITHWALWENGRANVIRAVKNNPALEYIRDEERIFPVFGVTEEGEELSLSDLGNEELTADGRPLLLLGGGGMGKTTALLRIAYCRGETYSAAEPAAAYISLYGWEDSGDCFIKNRILEHLRFQPHTDSMETARHELLGLLSTPLRTKRGDRPKLILLLDGLNEVTGDIGPLLKEIEELAQMPGVRVLAAGRSEIGDAGFRTITLKQLEEGFVRKVLSANGLLPPQDPALFLLLENPMLLSIFLKTALAGERQLLIDSQEQLLTQYFSAMLEKEVRNLPEDSPRRWYTQAALYFILPEIAKLEHTTGMAVSDQMLLPVIGKCYRKLSGPFMTRVFPQWIGHISDLRGGAKNADEWYGLMVQTVLWRRLGLIVRDEEGRLRVAHQLFREYLTEAEKGFNDKFIRLQRLRAGVVAVVAVLTLALFHRWVYMPYLAPIFGSEVKLHYDTGLSEIVVDTGFGAYIDGGSQYESISNLLDCFTEDGIREEDYKRYFKQCIKKLETDAGNAQPQKAPSESLSSDSAPSSLVSGYVSSLLASGEVMPWSLRELDEDAYKAMVGIPSQRAADYRKYVDILDRLRKDEKLWKAFGEDYVATFQEAVRADAYVLGRYYNTLIGPELEAMGTSDSKEERQNYHRYMVSIALNEKQDEITKLSTENIEKYTAQQTRAWADFRANGAIAVLGEGGNE